MLKNYLQYMYQENTFYYCSIKTAFLLVYALIIDSFLLCAKIAMTLQWHFPTCTVQLSSAARAFSEMNGSGLCCAGEVLILTPIWSLLLLQLDCLIKWQCPDRLHPLPWPTLSESTVSLASLFCPSQFAFYLTANT